MKIFRIFVAALVSAVLLFPQIAWANDWTEFGGSPERTRYSSENIGPPLEFNWQHNSGASMSQPILIGDKIYHLGGSKLWMLDAKAEGMPVELGHVENSSTPSHSDPTYDGNGGIYYGTGLRQSSQGQKYYMAYCNADTLTEKPSVPLTDEIVSAPLLLANDTVVVATADGKIHVVQDLSKGQYKKHWFQITNGRITSSAGRLGPDSFVIGLDSGSKVAAFKVWTDSKGVIKLTTLWSYTTAAGVPASISVDGDSVYFSDKGGTFYRLLKDTGKEVWRVRPLGSCFINDSPAVTPTGVFFGVRNYNGKGVLVRLDKATGALKWKVELEGMAANSPVVWGRAGVVLIGDSLGNIYAFNGANGALYEFAKYGSKPAQTVLHLQGGAMANWKSRFSGAGTQMTLASGNMETGLLLVGVNDGDRDGELLCFKLSVPHDLALSEEKLVDGNKKAQVTATFPEGKTEEKVDTTVAWGVVDASVTLAQVKAMTPEQLQKRLPNTIDLPGFGKGESRALEVSAPQPGTKMVFAINSTKTQPIGELNWDNNYVEVLPPLPECTDISVVNARYEPSLVYGSKDGRNVKITATVKRANDGPDGPVRVSVATTGPNGYRETSTFSLDKVQSHDVVWVPKIYGTGSVTFTYTATPLDTRDCAPGNNSDSVTVNVKLLPNMPNDDSGVFVAGVHSR